MTPFSAPGAGAAPPRPQGPPAAAGVPRPIMGSVGNNLAAAVRVAPPSSTPRVQAPIARPRMPLQPHAQGPPIAGVPRPMGGAPMSAPSPTPRMQAVPQPARAPSIPPNARAVGAAVPPARPHMPLSQPTQRAPAVANPAAPSLGKRPPTSTTGPAPVPAAKRHAPIPRPQQGAPLPAGAPSPSQHAQGAPTAGNAAPSRPPPTQQLPNLSYIGVYRDPSKGWMARAMDLKRRVARSIGPFDDPHLAALAHDRAAIACAGRGVARGAPLNFEAAFYRVETAFLHRWEGDVCEALEKGEYEEVYARFLRAGYKAALNIEDGDDGGGERAAHADELVASCVGDAQFFWDDVEDFFLCRAAEIGEEALKGKEDGRDDGGKLLRNRFVEMHRNKSLCPDWRHKNRLEKLRMMTHQKQQQIQMQQQQHQIHTQQQQQIQQRQQQIQMPQQQQQQNQMKPEQQRQIQQQHQVQMQQQRQQQIQQRQQHFQHQMMMQNQRQQQMMMAQQQQQYLEDDATVQVKQELS